MRNVTKIALLMVGAAGLICGCTDDQTTPSDQANQNGIENGVTNFVPTSLSGKTQNFNVTGGQNVTPPLNFDFTIDFNSETSYTLHPSGQNRERGADHQGNYTYEYHSGLIHFVETTPESGRRMEAVLTFNSATSGSVHLTTPNGEAQDAIFVQIAP
jgi:hypothetical protein